MCFILFFSVSIKLLNKKVDSYGQKTSKTRITHRPKTQDFASDHYYHFHQYYSDSINFNTQRTTGRIGRFSIDAITKAARGQTVPPDCTHNTSFVYPTPHSLCVLADERTVLGVNRADHTNIISVNIVDPSRPGVSYNGNSTNVYVLVANEQNDSLLAGQILAEAYPTLCYRWHDRTQVWRRPANLVQYSLSTGQKVRTYEIPLLPLIYSVATLRSVCFLGAAESNCFAVVDSETRQIVHGPTRTAIRDIRHMSVCPVRRSSSKSRAVLVVCGRNSDFSEGKTDVFEITELFKSIWKRRRVRNKK